MIHRPFFYIIKSKIGEKYVGAKWGRRKSNPDLFMNMSGYLTSSSNINRILNENAGVQFSIEEMIYEDELHMPFGCQTVSEYESWYINEFSCIENSEYLNRSPGEFLPAGSKDYCNAQVYAYGNNFPLQNEKIKKKFIETNNIRYGGNSPTSSKEVRDKQVKSFNDRTGLNVTNHMQSDESKSKVAATCLERYGGAPATSQIVKDKTLAYFRDTYGVDNPMKLQEFKDRVIETNLSRYGVEYYSQTKECQEKYISTVKNKYGNEYTNTAQLPEVKLKTRMTNISKWGVDSHQKIPFYCTECDKNSVGIASIHRYHKNHSGIFVKLFDEYIKLEDFKKSSG